MRLVTVLLCAVGVLCGAVACKESPKTYELDFALPEGDAAVDEDTLVTDTDTDAAASMEEGVRRLLEEHILFTNGVGIAVGVEDLRTGRRYAVAAGKSDAAKATPLTADHLFRVASITKTFVAATVLRLMDNQKVKLSDTLDRWYPDYPEADRITVRMLLNHTSGISDYIVVGEPEDIIARTALMPRLFEPGDGWSYSNTNYVLLGRIIEQVTGKTLGEVLADEVFARGELTVTALEKEQELAGALAAGHLYDENAPAPYTGLNPAWADGGIVSSVSDLAHFAARLFGGWIISSAALDDMVTMVSTGSGTSYGLGVFSFESAAAKSGYGHNGSLVNFNGLWAYFPQMRTAFAIQANYPTVMDSAFLLERIVALVANAEKAPVADACNYRDPHPDTPAPDHELVRFKGIVHGIDAEDPATAAAHYYRTGETGGENLFCAEYAFRSDEGESPSLYLIEECPEKRRLYTGETRVRRFELFIPLTLLAATKESGEGTIESPLIDYSSIEYWYDEATQRVTKRCQNGVPAGGGTMARVEPCLDRNTDFSAGEEVRLFAYLPLSRDIEEEKQCRCYNASGGVVSCPAIEDLFDCAVPDGYFEATGDAYAHLRIVGAIEHPYAYSPVEGLVRHDLRWDGAPFDATSYNNFTTRTDNGLGEEVLFAQSFGDLQALNANTYTFNATELIVPVAALEAAKLNEEVSLTAADAFFFSIHRYTQKIRNGEISYKKCFVAARDPEDTGASILPCYAGNDEFAIGEPVKLFGAMNLVADPASLGFYWPTTDDCLCFTAAGAPLDCDDFDGL
ncbi:MAG TPA: serine hydrolase domain-containing protein [bacterium]|nr:serine hydrolase domain-containing protein [bacterium]